LGTGTAIKGGSAPENVADMVKYGRNGRLEGRMMSAFGAFCVFE
jgi:hypothetical protein